MKFFSRVLCAAAVGRRQATTGAPIVRWLLLAALFSVEFSPPCWAAEPTLEWIRQFGTFGGEIEFVSGISLDGLGSLYVSGSTQDAFLRKYDVGGGQQWMQALGGIVSADGLGNVFRIRASGGVTLLKNYNADGSELWSRQLARGVNDGLSADGAGNVYAVGTQSGTTDDGGLVTKYDAAGNQLWSRQFGTSDHEQELLMYADAAGNVFTYGHSIDSDLPNYKPSATLTKFDAEGNEYWTRKIESARYVHRGGVVADALGNVYITGNSNAPLVEPRLHLGYDSFVAKYDAAGNQVWLQEFGTPDHDDSSGVALDNQGNLLVIGKTRGNMVAQDAGDDDPLNYDPYLAKFDTNGNELWIHQFGTPERDEATHIAADGYGNVYVAGRTRGDLGGPDAGGGGDDVFLAKFKVSVPEPSSLLLSIAGGFIALARRGRHLQRRGASRH